MSSSARSPGSPPPASSAACIWSRTCSTRFRARYPRHMLGMLLVGVLMYCAVRDVRAILRRRRRLRDDRGDPHRPASAAWLLGAAVRLQAARDLDSASARAHRAASSRPRCSWARRSAAAFAGALAAAGLPIPVSVPAFAMVGMGAMVGGGTGAVMTAVTMIFEMTRDYDIVMPMILAVGASVGVAPAAVAREHLHAQAGPPRPRHSEGAARQHVPGATCQANHGHRRVMVLPAEIASMTFCAARSGRTAAPRRGHARVTGSSACSASTPACARRLEGAHTGVTLGDVAQPRLHDRARGRRRLRRHRPDVAARTR